MDRDRRALDAPPEPVVVLDGALLRSTSAYAARSPRRRVIQPLHKDHADRLHRMLNAAEPGTYVTPHRHLDPPKAEAFVLLAGAADVLVFADDGALQQVIPLQAGGDAFGVDIGPGLYHCFLVRAPGTVLYEVKSGPYEAASDKDFAPWAPREGDPEAAEYLSSLEKRVEMWLAAEVG